MGSSDLQKIKKTVDNLYAEKQKLEKEKSKKGSKGKTKVNLRIETDSVSITYTNHWVLHRIELLLICRDEKITLSVRALSVCWYCTSRVRRTNSYILTLSSAYLIYNNLSFFFISGEYERIPTIRILRLRRFHVKYTRENNKYFFKVLKVN